MLKVVIVLIVAGVFCSNLANAKGISKEKCEEKGGKYCPGPKMKECYLFLKEEVSSFQDAFDLCVKNGAELPYYSITDYANLLNCSKIPWEFPYTMFFRNPLPTQDKCLTVTRMSVMEITSQNLCFIKGKAKVGCEIPL
ncbi:UNVERIFIED_CONTAM: hypothetical protein RMT77_017661 [Armadillidium vulgare]